jgi:hypothetical protein
MKTSEKLKEAYSELSKYNSPATQLILEVINEVVEMEEPYIIEKINELTRGFNITLERARYLMDYISKKYNISRKEAEKLMKKTGGMRIPKKSLNKCPNCFSKTINSSNYYGPYRYCPKCKMKEFKSETNTNQ